MGINVYYTTTEPVDASKRASIVEDARRMSTGYNWLYAEPVLFPLVQPGAGPLSGWSKHGFVAHPDEFEQADPELGPGNVEDVVTILCKLSRSHEVDWILTGDFDEPPGWIEGGVPDDACETMIEMAALLDDAIDDFDLGEP